MKFHKLLVFMMVFSLAVFAKASFAQDDDDDDAEAEEVEMDEDMWQAQMDEYTAKQTDLTNQLNSIGTEIDGLKKTLDEKTQVANNAVNALWAGVGSKSDYDAYKIKFADAEKRVNACKGPEDAADIEKNMWPYLTDAGQMGRMKCLPEFWDRYNTMKKKITDCKGKTGDVSGYTVVKGDCLYKIAGMKNIYGNSKLWPAIWEANKNGVVSAPDVYKRQMLRTAVDLSSFQRKAEVIRTETVRTDKDLYVQRFGVIQGNQQSAECMDESWRFHRHASR